MTETPSQGLGGRIPLLEPTTLDDAQKELYDHINAQFVPWADAAGFESKTSDGKLIGPFNPVLWSPKISASFLELQKTEEAHTSISERLRQVVILSVGSVWNAPYELYAHRAVARKAGLLEKTIQALAAGATPEELSKEERLVQQFTLQLTAKRRVDDAVFASALSVFGEKGLVDMITLAGCYMLVCSLLKAFEIPVPNDRNSKEERS